MYLSVWTVSCTGYEPVSYTHLDVYKRQVLYILYDFKAKVNIQRVEKRQQRQQQGKVEEQIGNRFALKAYQHCAAYDKKQTGRFFHKTGTCAARMASCSISLSFFPSSRASEDKISRCSSTGGQRPGSGRNGGRPGKRGSRNRSAGSRRGNNR